MGKKNQSVVDTDTNTHTHARIYVNEKCRSMCDYIKINKTSSVTQMGILNNIQLTHTDWSKLHVFVWRFIVSAHAIPFTNPFDIYTQTLFYRIMNKKQKFTNIRKYN